MKKFLSFILSTFFLLFLGFNSNAQNDTTTIIILHTNDMHSNIDNFPQITYLIRQYEKNYKNVFLFSAGDLFTGNPIVDRYKHPGYPMIDIMNHVGYDISAIGNHEFDVGQEELNARFKQADFPFVCANLNTSKALLNQPPAYKKLTTKNGITIGVLGLIQLDENGLPGSNPSKLVGIKFYNPFTYVKNYTTYQDSSDIFILLSHLGIKGDEKIAKENNCFNIIVGGHSHTYLQGGEKVGNTLIVQTGARLKALGVLTIKVVNKKIVFDSDTLINTNTIEGKDQEISNIVKKYNYNPYFDKLIGIAKHDIIGEAELGALMTDAMKDTLKCDIAFQNIGGIRTDKFSKGNITLKMIYELSPFGNVYYVYKLDVKQIKELITFAYNIEHKNELEVSGINIKLTVNSENELESVDLFNEDGSILENKIYTVAVNDYMASAYTLDFLKNGETKTNIIDAEATMSYIHKNSPIDYQGVNRIQLVKK